MKICVLGLWHLGSVTAACLAEAGFDVVGADRDTDVVAGLSAGRAPLFEPGLDALIAAGQTAERLTFSTHIADAVADVDIVWVCHDTPVDADDRADVDFVVERIQETLPHLKDGAIVLISSQLPAGSTAALERAPGARRVRFAYSPENLRLGKALDAFRTPDRIVVGIRDADIKTILATLFAPFCGNIHWVAIESAELVKHALNAFLATSVVFANEIATIAERIGASVGEVEAALRSEPRIGQRAYIRPGGSYAGGTLARDISFLGDLQRKYGLSSRLFDAVQESNTGHRLWPLHELRRRLGSLNGKRIAVLGLTYKPGTDTLRRSAAIELAAAAAAEGAQLVGFDPTLRALPDTPKPPIALAATAADAMRGAHACVVMTECPEFRSLSAADAKPMARPLIVDPGRFLESIFGARSGIEYAFVGAERIDTAPANQ